MRNDLLQANGKEENIIQGQPLCRATSSVVIASNSNSNDDNDSEKDLYSPNSAQ
jgi:hypothetical protein